MTLPAGIEHELRYEGEVYRGTAGRNAEEFRALVSEATRGGYSADMLALLTGLHPKQIRALEQ